MLIYCLRKANLGILNFLMFFFVFFKKKFFFQRLFFGDRERQSMNGGGAEREGDTESETRLQAPSHQPRARRGARTHGPREIATWLKSDA